jgi:Phosphotransferase enzyme family
MSDRTQDIDVEVPLTGGRYTVEVLRIGDTVRRSASSASVFMAELLRHLELKGYPHVPRYLGQDEKGRDILSYIPGVVPPKFKYFEDGQVTAATRMLRSFHDATRGTGLASGAEVVCHNDPGPNNTVFQNDHPVAFIDFDFAAPGDSVEDLAYFAWSWCISSKETRGPIETQASQLRLLADTYDLALWRRENLVEALIERQARNITFWSDHIEGFGGPPTAVAEIKERVAWSRREMEFTKANYAYFLRMLVE